ncbi:MAG: hypothetical protein A3F46_02960 [Legionellales bacterium RIFCSPHIGHO2_12_FULL_42_9]|nr:MAG: hypothetical protein A3F46_02960 [Legionellales bacterium RIFCSPHIGHO2_12_FULL_42_9]
MIKIIAVIVGLTISINGAAAPIVDLYGDESAKGEKILKKYSKQVSEIEVAFHNASLSTNFSHETKFEKEFLKRNQLIETIKKEGNYLYANFGTIKYVNKNHEYEYTTIEVVKKDQPKRLLFTSPMIRKPNYKPKNDLIDQMIEFGQIELKLFEAHQMESDPKKIVCPVYHCFLGFSDPQLKPYLRVFNTGAIKEKQLILDTLSNDLNPERRAAAAFLMGHFKDPNEIVTQLSSHLDDPDSGVRNNVLRVIGTTIKKAKMTQIDAKPYLKLLESTQATDRNKALLVLSTIARSPQVRPIMIRSGGKNLISLLRLKQPINHDFAYQILKTLSGKDLGETNYAAWENWLSLAKKKLV